MAVGKSLSGFANYHLYFACFMLPSNENWNSITVLKNNILNLLLINFIRLP